MCLCVCGCCQITYGFWLYDLCDVYIELIKVLPIYTYAQTYISKICTQSAHTAHTQTLSLPPLSNPSSPSFPAARLPRVQRVLAGLPLGDAGVPVPVPRHGPPSAAPHDALCHGGAVAASAWQGHHGRAALHHARTLPHAGTTPLPPSSSTKAEEERHSRFGKHTTSRPSSSCGCMS